MNKTNASVGLFDRTIILHAAGEAVRKLNPRGLMRNPVIFVTALTSLLVTVLVVKDGFTGGADFVIGIQVAIWLWFTVLFANFAEAVAEGRGKARADAFRATRSTTRAKVLADPRRRDIHHGKDAAELGAWLAGQRPLLPDLAFVSTAVRARATWDIIQQQMSDEVPQELASHLPELYGAQPTQLLALIRSAAARNSKRLMIVGHNPGLHEFALGLIGGGDAAGRAVTM